MNTATDLLADLISGPDLQRMKFPPLRWAVPGLLPEGFGLFTGAPKIGKSWATLDIALAVASGGIALGRIETGEPRPVLLAALEDGERRLQDRIPHLLGDGQPFPAMLHMATLRKYRPDGVIPLIAAFLDQHQGRAPLVILDTLGKVAPSARPGESAYQKDYRTGSVLMELAADCPGATLLVVHHVRKAGSDDWMDSTSGTNGLNGAAEWTVNVSRGRGDADGVIRVTGRDVPEGEYAVTGLPTRWTLDGDTLRSASHKATEVRATAGLGDRSADIVRIVTDHPDGIGPTELADIIGIEPKHAGEYLRRLANAGRIAKHTRGKYTRVETVESVETGNGEPPTFHTSTLSTHPTEEDSHDRDTYDAQVLEFRGQQLRDQYLGTDDPA